MRSPPPSSATSRQPRRKPTSRPTALTESGDNWGRSFALIASAAAARAAGNPAEALRLFEAALESADAGDHALNAAFSYTGAGLAHLEMGNVDEAAMKARQALGVLVRLDLEPHAALGVAVLDAQVRRARGEPEEAVRRLREVLAAAPGSTLLFPRRQALAHLAGSLVDAGRPRRGSGSRARGGRDPCRGRAQPGAGVPGAGHRAACHG